MKKLACIPLFFLLFLATCLHSCRSAPRYTFMQTADNIAAIDFIYVEPFINYDSYDHIKAQWSIATDSWEAFLNDFNTVTCKYHGMDPSYSKSGTVIRITYLDGGYEIISAYTGLHISSKNEWTYTDFHFDKDEFSSFIDKWRQTE